MSKTKFKLDHGLKTSEKTHFEVELRELTAGDIIEAEEDAEKLVNAGTATAPNYVLVRSDIKASMAILCRQIARIGDIQGPMEQRDLKKLHPEDLFMIQQHADAMDKAAAQSTGVVVAERGKSS
ncbi:phage tail assembly protein [Vibrio parahaemolyticus]|nr:phage tail assembly protein [Vibrio parahaemolyticus]MCR9657266.1 phage tail assembly protein [Vibrio parahaemolyticus]